MLVDSIVVWTLQHSDLDKISLLKTAADEYKNNLKLITQEWNHLPKFENTLLMITSGYATVALHI